MADIYTNQNNPQHSEEVQSYYDEIIALALLFMAGELTRAEYTAMHIELTEQSIVNGVILAGGVITSETVLTMLKEQQSITQESTRQLANDIEAGKYSPSDDRTLQRAEEMLSNRLALWTFTMGAAYNTGVRTAPQEARVRLPEVAGVVGAIVTVTALHIWQYGKTEAHCVDCAWAESQPPQPMSFWDTVAISRGIYPGSRSLKCTGFSCDCGYKQVGYMLPDGTEVMI